jgi:hypothetical protein
MIHTLEFATRINLSLADLFAFFHDPRNLTEITPKRMAFEIVELDEGEMRLGFRIVYRIKWMGVGLRWVTRIEEYDPPHRFVDVQVRGRTESGGTNTRSKRSQQAR